MNMQVKGFAATLAVVMAIGFGAQDASAATCPDYLNPARVFTLDPEAGSLNNASCYAYGTGNVNGESGKDPILSGVDDGPGDANTIDFASGVSHIAGLSLLDKSDQVGDPLEGVISGWVVDATGGTLTIGALASGYTNLILAIKSGNNLDPSWAAFKISGPGSYIFDIDPNGGNSHTNLYGTKAAVIPLPAAGWLLLGGLGGLAALRRRRKAA